MSHKERFMVAADRYKDAFFRSGPLDILAQIMIVLKVVRVISIPWLWALAPVWGGFIFRLLIIEIAAAAMKHRDD